MTSGDVNYSDGNVRVFTRGIRQTVKALEAAGTDIQDIKDAMRRVGKIVEKDVHAPVGATGKLRDSVRLSATKSASKIRAGGVKVPYAARIEYGVYLHLKEGGTKRIAGHFFFREAIRRKRGEVIDQLKQELSKLMAKHDLGDPPIRINSYSKNDYS